MQANIERIRKKRQAEQLAVPRTLADTLSDLVKAKKKEDEVAKPEVKPETNGSAKKPDIPSPPRRTRITPSPEPRRSPPRKRRDLSRSPYRRRSRSRGRKRSRREPEVSPSPSPPEELREMRKSKRRRRRSSS